MTAFFVRVLNMSITASVVALLMLIIRGAFRKRLPATYCYLLEGIVFFRLVVPFSVPAAISLFNLMGEPPASERQGAYIVTMDYLEGAQGYVPLPAADNGQAMEILAVIWFSVVVLMLLYGVVTYIASVLRVRTAFVVHCDDILQSCTERVGLHRRVKIYRSDAFDTPVVMGVFRPRIILPAFMELEERKTLLHIITHELVHIHRHDHVTKVIFTLALIVHWFNPLVWLMYFLFGRDIEASCDEKSLSLLGEEEKTGYATSLVALCTAQRRHMSTATLSFAESNIKERVTCALDYHPLSRWKMTLLSCLVLAVGLVTSTNPVVVAHGYAPVRHSVSKDAESRFAQAVPRLTDALTEGDTRVLMTLCGTTDAYYASLYAPLEKAPIVVTEYKLYPQSDELCYCYLHTEEGGEYTAVFTQRDGNVRLTTLTRGDAFEAAMAVDSSCEQVRFIKNLHRFGITTGFAEPQTLPRPAVAALCIDEEYHDRVKSGEIPPETKYLPPEWIAKAAQDYFGIADFSYTFDETLYSSKLEKYIYDPNRGVKIEAEIIAQRQEGEYTLVTAQFYRDPLHLMAEKSITYRLKKK